MANFIKDASEFPKPFNVLAEEIGVENVEKIFRLLGGGSCYIPKLKNIEVQRRNEKIRAEYTGYNVQELRKKYDLSAVWIRKIVKEQEKGG